MTRLTENRSGLKTAAELLAWAVSVTPTLKGFDPQNLPIAAKGEITNRIYGWEFDEWLTERQLDVLIVHIERVVPIWQSGRYAEQRYFVYADDSFAFSSNGDSEIWASVADFFNERVRPSLDRGQKLHPMDLELFTWMSGRVI